MTIKILRKNTVAVAAAMVLTSLAIPFSSIGATANVLVGSGGDHFVPAVTNIAVGDSVAWTWAGSFHSTTSGTNGVPGDDNGAPSGLWDSSVNNIGHTFTNTFTTAGTFSYYCSIHYNLGMTGAVVVVAANVPPTISITNPAANAVFSEPVDVMIQASASDSDGSVTNVQFLVGATVLTNEIAPPFSAVAKSLSTGNYTLSAIASDNSGATATNSIPISVVTAVPVSLANAAKLSDTDFQFSYSVNTGLTYMVQMSTNLATGNWIPLVTNKAASNPVVFVDLHATNSPAFYRVGRLPNP